MTSFSNAPATSITAVISAFPATSATFTKGDGTYTTAAQATVSVSTVSTQALAAASGVKYRQFINDSDTTVYLRLGTSATVNQGIRLNANGGTYEMSREIGNLCSITVNCIHGGTGTKTLLVLEGT